MDYNWLSSATAQCSATIVAILGGFIASRLLTINSERKELGTKIADLDDEISYKEKRIAELERWLLEEDAKDFIRDKTDELVAQISIENVYTAAESSGHDIEEYRQYWVNALKVAQTAQDYFSKHPSDLDRCFDDIARFQLSDMYDLTYDIWKAVYKSQKSQKIHSPYANDFSPPFDIDTFSSGADYSSAVDYRENDRELEITETEIEWLIKQKESYNHRRNALEKPQGMAKGITVFILFSILGIIVPMILMPYAVNQYASMFKWLDIGLFIVGLISVIWYLILFLRADSK